jgi:hypothetical protein
MLNWNYGTPAPGATILNQMFEFIFPGSREKSFVFFFSFFLIVFVFSIGSKLKIPDAMYKAVVVVGVPVGCASLPSFLTLSKWQLEFISRLGIFRSTSSSLPFRMS